MCFTVVGLVFGVTPQGNRYLYITQLVAYCCLCYYGCHIYSAIHIYSAYLFIFCSVVSVVSGIQALVPAALPGKSIKGKGTGKQSLALGGSKPTDTIGSPGALEAADALLGLRRSVLPRK